MLGQHLEGDRCGETAPRLDVRRDLHLPETRAIEGDVGRSNPTPFEAATAAGESGVVFGSVPGTGRNLPIARPWLWVTGGLRFSQKKEGHLEGAVADEQLVSSEEPDDEPAPLPRGEIVARDLGVQHARRRR